MNASAALLLAVGLLVGVPQSAAAVESCHGDTATIVGTPGGAVVGTDERDVVVTNGASTVDALAGSDVVCVTGTLPTSLDGGDGRDRVVVAMPDDYFYLDLRGSLRTSSADEATVAGFEDALARAHYVVLTGTNGPNDLQWNSCSGSVDGHRGADRVRWAGGDDLCGPGDSRATGESGGRGNDVLTGSPWADILVGGRGRDRGDGRAGFDRCRVERPEHCESDQ